MLCLVGMALACSGEGMTPEKLAHVRWRLEAFAAEVFTPPARRDQRTEGVAYLRGLLLDGRRKSMQPMAARLARIR